MTANLGAFGLLVSTGVENFQDFFWILEDGELAGNPDMRETDELAENMQKVDKGPGMKDEREITTTSKAVKLGQNNVF